MPNKYPIIFKNCVLRYYEHNTIVDTLSMFKISNGSLFNWIKLDKNNLLIEKTKYVKCNVKITPCIKLYIRSYILKHIDFKYMILIRKIYKEYNVTISKTTLYNTINQLNITRKKIRKKRVYGSKNKIRIKKRLLKKQMATINLDDVISIDESSFDTSISSDYGWSKKGCRIEKYVNSVRKRYTAITAISNKKVIKIKLIKGSANGEDFLDFIQKDLSNITNSYLFLDNARIHHYKKLKQYMTTSSNKLIYNVPYSPELNPIEMVFSKTKNIVRLKHNNNTKLIRNIQL